MLRQPSAKNTSGDPAPTVALEFVAPASAVDAKAASAVEASGLPFLPLHERAEASVSARLRFADFPPWVSGTTSSEATESTSALRHACGGHPQESILFH